MTEPTLACPFCQQPVGARHSFCRIYAETITHPYRQTLTEPQLVVDADLTLAGCGCSRILVDALGPHGGHHKNDCRRSTWITPVTRPDRDFPDGSVIFDGTLHFTACWTDHTVSRHGIHLPDYSTAFQSRPGFTYWDAAAEFLDELHDTGAIRALGVFLHIIPH